MQSVQNTPAVTASATSAIAPTSFAAANPTAEFDDVHGDPSRLFPLPLYQELGGD